jgi:hypothetical protein
MSARLLGASIVVSVVAGGCAPAGQVRASEPHARVEVRVEHGHAGDKASFVDLVYVDGLVYGLRSGVPLLLRLAPGKHELELVSQQTESRVALVPHEEPNFNCRTVDCSDQALNVPLRSDRLELTDVPQSECARKMVIEAEAGKELEATLLASPDGTCSLGS